VGLVARSVGQRPPRWSELVAHHPAARGERRRDASLRVLVRHPYRDVDRAAAVWTRLIHLLEPQRRPATVGVDEVLAGAVTARLIPEHGAPEWHHLGPNRRARDDKQALNRRWISMEAQPSGS